jgi:hypothetical protein
LNVHRVSDVTQIEIHTAEPSLPNPNPFEVEITVAKLKTCKSPGSVQIRGELIQAGAETLRSEIHKLIHSVWNKEEFPDQWKGFVIVPIYKKAIKQTVAIIVRYHYYQFHTKLANVLLSRLSPYIRVDEIIGDHQCGF